MTRIIFVVVLVALGLTGCAEKSAPPPKGPLKEYPLKGEIVQLDPKSQIAVIQHEEIPGFMKAMTMEFPVKDKVEFDKLKQGMVITATLFYQPEDSEYWIANIQPVEAAKGLGEPGPQ